MKSLFFRKKLIGGKHCKVKFTDNKAIQNTLKPKLFL